MIHNGIQHFIVKRHHAHSKYLSPRPYFWSVLEIWMQNATHVTYQTSLDKFNKIIHVALYARRI